MAERLKENKRMTVLSVIALAIMIFARITFWDGRPNIEHILIIAMITMLIFFQLYLTWERHSLKQKYSQFKGMTKDVENETHNH